MLNGNGDNSDKRMDHKIIMVKNDISNDDDKNKIV